MSNEQGTPSPDPSGALGGRRPAQSAREAGENAGRRDFARKAGLAAIGGAVSKTSRVAAAATRDALLGDSGTD